MIEIYRAAHPVQAHLLRGLLEAEGIAAAVVGEYGFNVRGEAPMTTETLPRVCIEHEADLPRAVAIAEAFDRSEPLEGVELDYEFLALEDPDAPEQ
jgi:hypothetical protein